MRAIVTFNDLSKRLIRDSPQDNKIAWNVIATQMQEQMIQLSTMKNAVHPKDPVENINAYFNDLVDGIVKGFRDLEESHH